MSRGPVGGGCETRGVPETPDPSDRWRAALDGYLVQPEPAASAGFTALALQFEIRELIARTAHNWNGPLSKTATATGAGEMRLGVRPVTRSARTWSRGSLTWSNLPHLLNRQHLDPDQHRWFCQFVAMHRAARPAAPDRDAAWVYLDEFVNPVLWQLLEQATTLGIELVGATPTATVRLAERAELRLDVVRAAGGILVSPTLLVDDAPAALANAHAIGDHGVYLAVPGRPQSVTLAPTAALGPEQLLLLRSGDTGWGRIEVPEADTAEFVARHLPELRDRIDLGSSDGSVTVPPPAPPLLVLTATFGPRAALELEWAWQRSAGGLDVVADLLPAAWITAAAVPLGAALRGVDAAEFAARVLPQLRERRGVRVEVRGTQPDYRELVGTPHLTVTTVPTERRDWFDLGVEVTVDGRTIPFVPLFKALAAGRKKLLLVDGTFMSLSHPAFGPLADLIMEAEQLAEWQTTPMISRHQTSLWADFEDLADESVAAVEWRELLADSATEAPKPVAAPSGLRAELRPYQAEGFAWLAFLWRHRLGGVLADDMGLGKTLQCLALMQHIVETDAPDAPFLVVAPTSVVSTWVAEAARFAPALVVREITATQASSGIRIADAARGAHLVVTSYALLRLDTEAYREVAWPALFLDEAQFVKNPAAQVHEAARDLDVPVKIAVTGTPFENSLTELHAVFQIVAPGLFASARRFGEQFVRSIEQEVPGISSGRGGGRAAVVADGTRAMQLARLRRRIRPFLLRRTKQLVASELPPKQEQVLTVELAPAHRELYEVTLQRERRKLFGLLDDLDRNRFTVFRSLTLLRLLALDASLVSAEHGGVPSSKLDVLFEQLDDVIAEGHRALVFSQFTSYLAISARRLDAAGIPYVMLDGSTRHRREVVESFRAGQAPVFLISLKAGGFGLTLTEADYVFLLDPWWNPASERQAIDRTHRIGQTRTVMVYRMISAGTIEEKVMALGQRKAALFDAMFDDDELFSSALSAEDIRELLE